MLNPKSKLLFLIQRFHKQLFLGRLKFSVPLDLHQFDFEDQNGILRNFSHRAVAVTEFWWDLKFSDLSNTHPEDSSVPAFNYLTRSKCEC